MKTLSERVDKINDSINQLAHIEGIEGAALVSKDGFMIASALTMVHEDRVAAISAAMLAIGEKTVVELKRGNLREVYVRGDEGYVILTSAGTNAIIVVLASKDAQLGLILYDMNKQAKVLAGLL